MPINISPEYLFAGVDHLSLDKRKFDPSRDDIQRVCRFFPIGKLQHYEKEKNIIVSHANFFVFLKTDQGQYALKFYPKDASKTISIEYAINRVLIDHDFPTPAMFNGRHSQPFISINGLLATCYSYINGIQAWKHIKEQNTIRQINTAMLDLKKILSIHIGNIPFQKLASFSSNINTIAQTSRKMSTYDHKELVDATLLDVCRSYQSHQPLFNSQLVHNDITLTNMLIYKKTVYTLDLSHIRMDYTLSDLASLVISCLFFDIPVPTVKTIAKDYFIQHKIKPAHFIVLNTLVKIGLIREYLKNIQRERSPELSTYPPDLVKTYLSHLSKRKRSITAILKRMADTPRLIV